MPGNGETFAMGFHDMMDTINLRCKTIIEQMFIFYKGWKGQSRGWKVLNLETYHPDYTIFQAKLPRPKRMGRTQLIGQSRTNIP
jgi:hypothetical protein